MTKHRKSRRRSQKGGSWYNPGSWFGSSTPVDPNAPKKSWLQAVSGTASGAVNGASNLIGEGASSISTGAEGLGTSVMGVFNTDVGSAPVAAPVQPVEVQPVAVQPVAVQPEVQPVGGRRKKRCRTMKGGKGLGLTYYATPVSGLKVAEPTTWQYYANGTNQYSTCGGSRRKKSSRRKSSRRKSSRSCRNKKH